MAKMTDPRIRKEQHEQDQERYRIPAWMRTEYPLDRPFVAHGMDMTADNVGGNVFRKALICSCSAANVGAFLPPSFDRGLDDDHGMKPSLTKWPSSGNIIAHGRRHALQLSEMNWRVLIGSVRTRELVKTLSIFMELR
jgi:hypothetical protein